MAEKSFSTHVNQIYLPGDSVTLSKTDEISTVKIVLGPGLRKYGKQILVTKPGVLRTKASPATYWIDCHHKRYVPARGDDVIGVVTNKVGESYKVNIGSSEEASLSSIAFPGATKKNKPNIQIGDLVFAKLLIASIDMEPELVCVNSLGENVGLGVLSTSGFLFTVPLHHIRKSWKKIFASCSGSSSKVANPKREDRLLRDDMSCMKCDRKFPLIGAAIQLRCSTVYSPLLKGRKQQQQQSPVVVPNNDVSGSESTPSSSNLPGSDVIVASNEPSSPTISVSSQKSGSVWKQVTRLIN